MVINKTKNAIRYGDKIYYVGDEVPEFLAEAVEVANKQKEKIDAEARKIEQEKEQKEKELEEEVQNKPERLNIIREMYE